MNIEKLIYDNRRNGHYTIINDTGNSDAIEFPVNFSKSTVMLSSIANGSAKIQYSLASPASVGDDTAIWHDWSVGDLTSSGGIVFDGPMTYIRVVAGNSVNYILEVLV